MTISRGQMPRQMYGLGSLVKSIGKTVKKIVSGEIESQVIDENNCSYFESFDLISPTEIITSIERYKNLSTWLNSIKFVKFV